MAFDTSEDVFDWIGPGRSSWHEEQLVAELSCVFCSRSWMLESYLAAEQKNKGKSDDKVIQW